MTRLFFAICETSSHASMETATAWACAVTWCRAAIIAPTGTFTRGASAVFIVKALDPVGNTLSARATRSRAHERSLAGQIENVAAKHAIALWPHFIDTFGASLDYNAAKIIVKVTLLEDFNERLAKVSARRVLVYLTSRRPSN